MQRVLVDASIVLFWGALIALGGFLNMLGPERVTISDGDAFAHQV